AKELTLPVGQSPARLGVRAPARERVVVAARPHLAVRVEVPGDDVAPDRGGRGAALSAGEGVERGGPRQIGVVRDGDGPRGFEPPRRLGFDRYERHVSPPSTPRSTLGRLATPRNCTDAVRCTVKNP